MSYVEGRLASRRAKSTALTVLTIAIGASFAVGVLRNARLPNAEPPPAPAAAASDVPYAVAYAGPLTDAPAQTEPVRRARRAPTPGAEPMPTLQADAAPAAESAAADAVVVMPAPLPAEPLKPPPSV